MRYLKMLGLAAVAAAAVMAFAGAGTASAETTACETTTEPCTKGYGVGTAVEATDKEATLTSESFFGSNVKCHSLVTGKIETATTPSGKGSVSWKECTGAEEVETKTNGTTTFHHDPLLLHGGIATIEGFVIRVKQSGVNCWYGGKVEGTLTPSNPPTEPDAVLHVTQEVELVTGVTGENSSTFLCPAHPVWHATYRVIHPTPLYITTGV